MPDRAHDLVVWGATGFTGRLICEHIAQQYQVHCTARANLREAAGKPENYISALLLSLGRSHMGHGWAQQSKIGGVRQIPCFCIPALQGNNTEPPSAWSQSLLTCQAHCSVDV